MMRHVIAIATFAVLLTQIGVFAVGAGATDPERVPWEPKDDATNVCYWGTVTQLTKDSITIQFPNKKLMPKTFPVSEILGAGKVPMEPRLMPGVRGLRDYHVSPSDMYRLTDLKVGDWVAIHYARLGGMDICDHICIQKRPGGRIPPLPDEAEELMRPSPSPLWAKNPLRARYIPYHERMNAYWDLVDHGTAYPAKFGENRRFPPAPAPREVKLGSPTTP